MSASTREIFDSKKNGFDISLSENPAHIGQGGLYSEKCHRC
jgi:hypothetical protein